MNKPKKKYYLTQLLLVLILISGLTLLINIVNRKKVNTLTKKNVELSKNYTQVLNDLSNQVTKLQAENDSLKTVLATEQ